MQVDCGSWIRWLASRIRSCADKLGCGWERDEVQRTAKRYDDDGHGKDAGLRLLLLAAVVTAMTKLPLQANRRRMTKTRRTGATILAVLRLVKIRSSIVYFQPIDTLKVLWRVQGVGSVSSFSAQPDSTMEILTHPLAVLSHLRPRFAYILDRRACAKSHAGVSTHLRSPLVLPGIYYGIGLLARNLKSDVRLTSLQYSGGARMG